MAQNYVLLERIELNASAASVTFSNIPQSGYTDLKVVASTRGDTGSGVINLSFNGVTTNLSGKTLYGGGTAAASGSPASTIPVQSDWSNATASTFGNVEFYIPNYTSSNFKSVSADAVAENNATEGYQWLTAGLWSNTAAITSVTLTSNSSNFVQYSTFSLYGLAAVGTTPAIAPKASGGNITTDGTYWIHTFLTTQAFTPFTNLTCDALVVAGGGGGGGYGGGGAGGLLYQTARSVTSSTNYTVTVGAGGSGGAAAGGVTGGSGTNSVFDTSTALGGGGGAATQPGANGGSAGGGGPISSSVDGAGGSATQGNSGGATGYGNNGGNAKWDPQYPGGGGGGAGAVGTTGTSAGGLGNGGIGRQYNISGTNTYYAGGGGGGAVSNAGTGGSGGGGNGFKSAATSVAGTAGTTNTGGGGGGGRDSTGYAGGSGIVIIRYTIA